MRNYYWKVSLIFALLMILCISVYCSNAANNQVTIDSILTEIKTKQSVDSKVAISSDEVSDEQLVKLGKAVLSLLYTDPDSLEYVSAGIAETGTGSLYKRYKTIGIQYMESGYSSVETKRFIEEFLQKGDDDYHVGFGEIMVIIILLLLIIIIGAINYFKRKAKLQ